MGKTEGFLNRGFFGNKPILQEGTKPIILMMRGAGM
jgi:hypothetical protein